MIKGMGIDLIELERVKEKWVRHPEKFVQRTLTERERERYQAFQSDKRKLEYLSGRFAAKEAFVKAAGTGIGKAYSFQDIEVLTGEEGAPYMSVRGVEHQIWVSIAHSEGHALAQVIIESRD
ncbi:4'-phosphopantetheinyl transferase [Pontibacillus halophilus JSM 076056 = DSM 19796]|uniref:Holo-[acyl-carrier-protein] synthase n=1 Tax=Pontibacillus halophilus JSM 076056 = DSM 19796 TaxID=1385510 RepID=A0A0A5GH84_9BACI|nr:holo-ACP synthase [Pontibacillus halophilus]KGX90568.1 4'-phosphopantetheinyl transferase [Pontibacillus halophilus JSM 076056 = DSM 19796]